MKLVNKMNSQKDIQYIKPAVKEIVAQQGLPHYSPLKRVTSLLKMLTIIFKAQLRRQYWNERPIKDKKLVNSSCECNRVKR